MIIGQIGEMISMVLVPLVVARIGMKWTMTLGGLAYVAMFALNMLGQPWALMVGANILHGFCFGFLFVVALMYVDKAASADIKASAQSLFVFVVSGLFNVVGNVGAGYIRDRLLPNWAAIWAIPLGVTAVFLLVFVVLFREEKIARDSSGDTIPISEQLSIVSPELTSSHTCRCDPRVDRGQTSL